VKGKIEIDRERCKGCGLCILVCPKHKIEISDLLNAKGYYPARSQEENVPDDKRECTGCALCAITCPDVAIEVYRETKKEGPPKVKREAKKEPKAKKSPKAKPEKKTKRS
jgi:2-oxoglutarate ferredoxin oxidoreductase subunit delta